MTKGTFRFRQFEVRHMCSSMRVGTDAVLLGAWTGMGRSAENVDAHILDIGCGCGVLALMVAQRSVSANVIGIDVDAPSIDEARENAASSPFAGRVQFRQADVRAFAKSRAGEPLFSLIVCNPPYYTEDTLPTEERRSIARNACHLSFAELLDAVSLLLAADGLFSVVIPMQARDGFMTEALKRRLYLRRECRVQTVVRKAPKRLLMEFGKEQCPQVATETLVLQDVDGCRTSEYSSLCADFYL